MSAPKTLRGPIPIETFLKTFMTPKTTPLSLEHMPDATFASILQASKNREGLYNLFVSAASYLPRQPDSPLCRRKMSVSSYNISNWSSGTMVGRWPLSELKTLKRMVGRGHRLNSGLTLRRPRSKMCSRSCSTVVAPTSLPSSRNNLSTTSATMPAFSSRNSTVFSPSFSPLQTTRHASFASNLRAR